MEMCKTVPGRCAVEDIRNFTLHKGETERCLLKLKDSRTSILSSSPGNKSSTCQSKMSAAVQP